MTAQVFNMDEEREETVIERRDRERAVENGKVDNTEEIPLIPGIKLDARKTIVAIEVWKEDAPGNGYKGRIPPTGDLELVSQLFGNGLYEFRAVNAEKKILRRTDGVRVNIITPPTLDATPVKRESLDKETQLLQWQADQHARESQRTEAFGKMAVDSTRDTAREHARMLSEQHATNSARDREFFQSLLNQSQQFAANMLQQAEANHRMAMERSQQDFQRTIQVMTVSHTRAQEATDPRNLLGMFQQFMALTGGLAPDDEEEDEPESEGKTGPWEAALTQGMAAIKDITEMAKIKAAVTGQPAQPQQPAKTLPRTTTQKPKKRGLPEFTREELKTVLQVKRAMTGKGLDFNQTVRQLMPYLIGGNQVDSAEPHEPEPEAEGVDASEESDSEESGSAEVEDT